VLQTALVYFFKNAFASSVMQFMLLINRAFLVAIHTIGGNLECRSPGDAAAVAVIKRVTWKFTQAGYGCVVLDCDWFGHDFLIAQTVPKVFLLLLRHVEWYFRTKTLYTKTIAVAKLDI